MRYFIHRHSCETHKSLTVAADVVSSVDVACVLVDDEVELASEADVLVLDA